jgi:uncharacterized repeat protein (TIGR01451 family)
MNGTIFGHATAVGAEAVGSAFYRATPRYGIIPARLEPFSSIGLPVILYDLNDTRVYEVREKPEIVAPDGTNTTFFGRDIDDPGDGSDTDNYPNFFGTSAAAPHAAAVAALLLESAPSLHPTQVYELLERTSLDMEIKGFDARSGYGFLHAFRTLSAVLSSDLQILRSQDALSVLPGQPITYSLTFHNNGPHVADHIVITDTVPANLLDTRVSSKGGAATGDNFVCQVNNLLVCQVNNLAVGESGVIAITGRANPKVETDLVVVGTAVITNTNDVTPANNYAELALKVHIPQVQFIRSSYEIHENEKGLALTITLNIANPYADVSVTYSSTDDSALANNDYTQTKGLLVFQKGQTVATISIPIVNDDVKEAEERFTLALSHPVGARLGPIADVTIVIVDDDNVHSDEKSNPSEESQFHNIFLPVLISPRT